MDIEMPGWNALMHFFFIYLLLRSPSLILHLGLKIFLCDHQKFFHLGPSDGGPDWAAQGRGPVRTCVQCVTYNPALPWLRTPQTCLYPLPPLSGGTRKMNSTVCDGPWGCRVWSVFQSLRRRIRNLQSNFRLSTWLDLPKKIRCITSSCADGTPQ